MNFGGEEGGRAGCKGRGEDAPEKIGGRGKGMGGSGGGAALVRTGLGRIQGLGMR